MFLLLCYRQWHIKRVFIEFELFQFLFNCQNTTQNTAIKIETCLGRYLNTRCELCCGFLPLVVLSQEERSFCHYRQAEVFNWRFLTVTGDWWQLFSLWSHISSTNYSTSCFYSIINQSVNLNGRKSVPAKFSYFLRKDFFLSWDDNEERFPFRLVGVFLSRGWRGNDQLWPKQDRGETRKDWPDVELSTQTQRYWEEKWRNNYQVWS